MSCSVLATLKNILYRNAAWQLVVIRCTRLYFITSFTQHIQLSTILRVSNYKCHD